MFLHIRRIRINTLYGQGDVNRSYSMVYPGFLESRWEEAPQCCNGVFDALCLLKQPPLINSQ